MDKELYRTLKQIDRVISFTLFTFFIGIKATKILFFCSELFATFIIENIRIVIVAVIMPVALMVDLVKCITRIYTNELTNQTVTYKILTHKINVERVNCRMVVLKINQARINRKAKVVFCKTFKKFKPHQLN